MNKKYYVSESAFINVSCALAKRIKHENMLDVDLDFHLTLPKIEENKNEV